jgi:hypothetical protein
MQVLTEAEGSREKHGLQQTARTRGGFAETSSDEKKGSVRRNGRLCQLLPEPWFHDRRACSTQTHPSKRFSLAALVQSGDTLQAPVCTS